MGSRNTQGSGRQWNEQIPFAALLERLPAGAYACDSQGLITYYNEQAVRLWGREPKLNDPTDRFCGSFRLFSVDGTPIRHENCWMAKAIQTGQDYNGEEIVVERPDGQRVVALAHASPVRDEQGALVGAVNVLVDITERKQAEEELRQARERLQTVTDTMSAAVARCSRDHRYMWVSQEYAKLLKMDSQAITGKLMVDVIGKSAYETLLPCLERALNGERVEFEGLVNYANIGPRWINVTYVPTCDSQGCTDGWVAVLTDITCRKELEEALRQADRRKDEFLAILAHELRNPLAPICNSLHIMRLSDDLSPAVERVREIMERQVNLMVRLVDDLLEVSRITRGKVELRRETIDLAAVVRSAVETSRPLIEAARHQLAITLPTQPVRLNADPVRLAQVIGNLLNNAAKYTKEGGQIWLTAREEGETAVISVRDTGLGIPSQMLPHVFDMFAQVDRTLNRSQGGLGIGLTLSKSLIEMHGGRIEAQSEGPGKGSEFIVHLPLVRDEELSCPASAMGPSGSRVPALSSRRILVVDDTPSAAYILGKLLEKLGHQVWTIHDAVAALEFARKELPDIVISDIGMPQIDGYEFARRIRQVAGLEHVMLIALTGYGQRDDRQQAIAAGFDFHLVKPVSLEVLQETLGFYSCRPNLKSSDRLDVRT